MSAASDFMGGGGKLWVSGVTYKQGQVVMSPADNYQAYVRVTAAGSGATDPSSDTTNYRPFGGRALKSLQRGVITIGASATSATATISAVVTGKSKLTWLGGLGIVNTSEAGIPRIDLTNSTTITATTRGAAATNTQVGWQLEEFY
ncbi:hypothetical protein [Acidovorax sp. Root568]|uniref:hypothetical protein n=1 Tax=Acidovorax sp. Root568 TaxID=1736565 RepID=UPI0006F711F3|nr:hypothetical protein [Acidovorax sp. Root568]KRA13958.1 hypothetical protein ASD75_04660 [Acidovorax sp. Root568]